MFATTKHHKSYDPSMVFSQFIYCNYALSNSGFSSCLNLQRVARCGISLQLRVILSVIMSDCHFRKVSHNSIKWKFCAPANPQDHDVDLSSISHEKKTTILDLITSQVNWNQLFFLFLLRSLHFLNIFLLPCRAQLFSSTSNQLINFTKLLIWNFRIQLFLKPSWDL